MQQEKIMQTEGFCLGGSHHEMQLTPVKMDSLYVKAYYSQEEDWTCEYVLNTNAWD